MNQETVAHDGLHFRCRLEGPEGAPWMVFSNSLATDLTLWDHQVAHFATRFRTLRYDQRGHGGTTVPPGPATIAQLADDAHALMAHFGVTGAVFIGVSMGAATGLCLAPRPDSRIARLVAADGNAATPYAGSQAWAERIDFATRNGMPSFADLTIPRWFAATSRAARSPAVALVRTMIVDTPLAGLVACATALKSYDVTATLSAITQPTLLIAGSADGAMPQTMPVLATSIPGARYLEIPGAGHLPCIEQPAAFNAAIEAFIA